MVQLSLFPMVMSGRGIFIFDEAKARAFCPHLNHGLSIRRQPPPSLRHISRAPPSPRDGGYYRAYTMFHGRTNLGERLPPHLQEAYKRWRPSQAPPQSLPAIQVNIEAKHLFVGPTGKYIAALTMEARLRIKFSSAYDDGETNWDDISPPTKLSIRIIPEDYSREAKADARFAHSAIEEWAQETNALIETKQSKKTINVVTFSFDLPSVSLLVLQHPW
jgi:hypothetical protein